MKKELDSLSKEAFSQMEDHRKEFARKQIILSIVSSTITALVVNLIMKLI